MRPWTGVGNRCDCGVKRYVADSDASFNSCRRGADMHAEEIDFSHVFKLHPTAMALFSPDLVFIDANDEFVAVTGWPLQDMLGKHAFTVLPKIPPDPGGH